MKKLNEPNKQRSASGLSGLLAATICTATVWQKMLGRTLLFSLLIMMLMAVSPSAFAQSPINTGKNGQGTTMPQDPGASPSGSRGTTSGVNGYLQRFPFAAAAYKADTLSQSSAGVYQSNAGTMATQSAYQMVLKMCDEGYGIAYFQIPMVGQDKPAAARDSELFQNLMTTFGYPMSDSQFQVIQRENNQRLLELAFDPERVMWATSSAAQTGTSSVSKSMANTGLLALMAVFNYIINGDGNTGALINVANEGAVAGLTYSGNGNDIGVAQAVYMVQVMYKLVFIPMAVLFLLPGAIISQVKSMTAKGFGMQATESQSPFDGILRSIVAVFLIPATQVIVSWSIDTGNSLAYSVNSYVDLPTITSWVQQLCYGPALSVNAIQAPQTATTGATGGGGGMGSIGSTIGGAIGGSLGSLIGGAIDDIIGGSLGGYAGTADGLAMNQPAAQSVIEQQDWMGQALQTTLNGAMLMAAITLIILSALQVVTMCYLLLLGPISAAFYAWPQVSSTHLFRGVFGKWVDGVIKISMWRFLWIVILAIMTQRIIYMGGQITDLRWEVAVFICFLGLMVGVPATPFTYQPFAAFQSARQIQSQSSTQQMGMGAQSGQGQSAGGGTPQGSQGGNPGGGPQGGAPSGGSPGGGAVSPASGGNHGGANSGAETPTNAGGANPNNTKDGHPGSPPPAAGQPAGAGTGTPGGTPAAPGAGGAPTGAGGPPGTGGPGTGGTGPGAQSAGGAPAAAGGPSATGTGGAGGTGSTNVSVSMPTSAPAVGATPPAGASPSSPAVVSNPGAPAAAAPAPAAAAPAGGEGGGGDDKKSGGKTGGNTGGDAGGAAAAVQGALGNIGGTTPPPPAAPPPSGT